MLADKIKEGKITKKWIERCLPQEYRRRYAKSEQSSLSGKAKNLEKIMIVDNKQKTIAVEREAIALQQLNLGSFEELKRSKVTRTPARPQTIKN